MTQSWPHKQWHCLLTGHHADYLSLFLGWAKYVICPQSLRKAKIISYLHFAQWMGIFQTLFSSFLVFDSVDASSFLEISVFFHFCTCVVSAFFPV